MLVQVKYCPCHFYYHRCCAIVLMKCSVKITLLFVYINVSLIKQKHFFCIYIFLCSNMEVIYVLH